LLIVPLPCDEGCAIASLDSAGDDATPTATIARSRSRLSMSPYVRQQGALVDYLASQVALQERVTPRAHAIIQVKAPGCDRVTTLIVTATRIESRDDAEPPFTLVQ
jgi:hypothetical protein